MKLQESDREVIVILEDKDLSEHLKDTEVTLTNYVRRNSPARMCIMMGAVNKVNALFWGILSTFARQQIIVRIQGANEHIRNRLKEASFYKLFYVEESVTK